MDTTSDNSDFYSASITSYSSPLTVVSLDNTTYSFPVGGGGGCGALEDFPGTSLPTSIEDRNGNIITITGPCDGSFTVKDTLNRTLLSSSGFGSTGNTVTVSGLTQPYTLTWGTASSTFAPGFTWDNPTDQSCSSSFSGPGSSLPVVTAITIPNGKQYTFTYDTTYGLLSKITYPNGGYVSYSWTLNSRSDFAAVADVNGAPQNCLYTYDTPAIAHRYVSFDGSTIAEQQDFSYTTTWNPNDYTSWTTKQTTVTTHDLVNGTSFQTAYTYSPVSISTGSPWIPTRFGSQMPVEQTVVYKGTSGNTLRTVNKTWYDQFEIKTDQTTLDTGQSSQVNYTWNTGLITEKDELDFGQSTPTRKTLYTYGGGFNQPCQTIVEDGNNTHLSETDTYFDNVTTLCALPTAPVVSAVSNLPTGTHDETKYGPSATTVRGNVTNVTRLCFPGCTNCATTFTYDETGQALTSTDPNGHVTQYSYADSYTVLSGGANVSYTPTANTNAFLTKITNPLSQTQNFTYDFNNGQLTIEKDQNALTTTYLYNDSLARLTSATRPDNGQTTIAYNDTAHTVTTSKKINTSQTITTVAVADGLGHVKQTQLTSDPQGTVYVDTTYDGLGRVRTVSNPYRSGSDPTTTLGTTTNFYDALGRKCLEVPPDGTMPTGNVCPSTQPANDLFTTYSGNTTTVTDQTGKSRKSVTDGLGRLTQIFEEPSGLNYETDYQYDALGNLLCAGQKGTNSGTFSNCASIPAGWRARNFGYDSLSRLLSSNNPEVGTITYKYDSDTNCASPNSFVGLLVSKTDARGIRACAQYDAINREVALNYSNGDPTVTTIYDQANCLGLGACQNIGHRTSMTDSAGSEAWSYQVDAANNRSAHVDQRTTNSTTKTSTYYLDQGGNVTQAVYPTGRVVNYTYDNANRPSTAADGSNGITYATDFQTAPTGCPTGKVCYTPQGTFYALSIGQSASFTGLNLAHTYNSRLQPNEFKASSSGGNAIDITYSFADPATSHNAGHVYSITNNLDSTRSQAFTYDSLNRITTALTASTYSASPAHCWGESYSVDAWGNLQSVAATSNPNYTGCSQESGFTASADGNNHLSGFSYDASGNTQGDGVNSYTWDGESQLKTSAGVTYVYDGDGRRVSKVGSKLYWYGSGSEILTETDASGNTTAEYVFFGGKRVAQLNLGSLNVRFTNDSCSGCNGGTPVGGGDRNLFINSVTVGSTTILPNDASVSYTAYPCNSYANGVGQLLCNGDLIVNKDVGAPGQTVIVNAYGSSDYNIYPHMQLLLNGIVLAQWDVTGTAQNYSVTIPNSSVQYYVEDMLGTSRVITDASGAVCYDADFYPYGGERPYTNTCPQNYKFEGKERDTETGNDDFGARYYSNRFGRWLSADWSNVPVPVPYANLANPQTLNLYAMVVDDPESFADLDGHIFAQQYQIGVTGGWDPSGMMGESDFWTDGSEIQMSMDGNPPPAQAKEQQRGQGSAAPPSPQTPPPPENALQKTKYQTIDAAAKAAETRILDTSLQQGVEYGGRIYKNPDGTYSIGTPRTDNNPVSVAPPPISSLPPGTQNAARYHTHPNVPGYDHEHFSPADKRNARNEHVPSYIGTADHKLKRYDPSAPIDHRITTQGLVP